MKAKAKAAASTTSDAGSREAVTIPSAPLSKPVTESGDLAAGAAAPLSHDDIAERAYLIWEARGGQGGAPDDDWQRAIAELTLERQRTDG